MEQSNTIDRPARPLTATGTALVWLAFISGLAALALLMLPGFVFSEDTIGIVVTGAAFVVLLCVGLGSAIVQHARTRVTVYRLALLIWWFLLVCEVIFDRLNDEYHVYQGTFATQAYGEAVMWVLSFITLLLISLQQPSYFGQLFSKSFRWVSLFTLACLASIAYAPGKMYSAAWGFKLLLVVLLLQLCADAMRDFDDVVIFLKTTLWAFLVLTIVPVLVALSNPATAFVEQRLNATPDLLSPLAGSLLLMAMTLYALEKRRIFALAGGTGAVIMILAFGKTGIISGVLGAVIFLVLQKKVMRSVGLLVGLAVLGILILSVTPLGDYLRSYQGGSTFTGRTALWEAALAATRQKLIFGHGYLATYFSWRNSSGLLPGYLHLHNGFVEIAYNNGLVGLGLMLAIHVAMVKNIFSSLRMITILRSREPGNQRVAQAYFLTIGSLALYINVFVEGMFGSSFGGRLMSPFMLFLGLFMMVASVQRLTADLLRHSVSTRDQIPAAWPASAH